MLSVAREMNCSETAFLVWEDDGFRLRWFTPAVEVALCGHATLASAHVLWDEGAKVFRMWYSAMSLPYDTPDTHYSVCYAESDDGMHWVKPNLGLVEFQGSRDNNILGFYKDYAPHNVIKTPYDPDPARRYKALGEVEPLDKPITFHGAGVSFSPDGIRWTDCPHNPVVPKGPDFSDGSMILGWDVRIKKYVAYYRPGRPQYPQWPGADAIRTVGYSESDDFIHWTPTRPMLVPDEKDRVDSQYHHINVAQDGEFYIGLMPLMQTHEMTWDVYLLSSRNGFHWTWVDRNRPFLGRGEVGSYDAGYLSASAPIVHDNLVWIYYGAYSGSHSYVSSNPASGLEPLGRATVALATLPVDRYVGLLAGPRPGFATTRALTFRGSRLMIDFDASLPINKVPPDHPAGAQVRVAVVDTQADEIHGFGIAQCEPMSTSGVHEVSWGGADLSQLQGQRIRLRFEWRHAALYSFQFKE